MKKKRIQIRVPSLKSLSQKELKKIVEKKLGKEYKLQDFSLEGATNKVSIPALKNGNAFTIIVRKKQSKIWLLLVLLLLLLVGAGGYYLWNHNSTRTIIPAELAPDIKDAKNIDSSELMERMQKKVDEGYYNLQINSEMIFQNGKDEGMIQVVNADSNKNSISLDVYLDEKNELVYQSGSIDPGQYINKGKLKKQLPKGKYAAHGKIIIYNEKTKVEESRSSVEMTIEVKE